MSDDQLTRPEVWLSTLQSEQQMLRAELKQLKGCQLQYFTLSVTGTAAVFGLAATSTDRSFLGIAFLAPLAIVLPCWLIFSDKATTITRIVGYYRVIERMIGEYPSADTPYIGYERGLALYRTEDDGDGRQRMEQCPAVEQLRRSQGPGSGKRGDGSSPAETRHRYWRINFRTYFVLSLSCCFLSALYLILGRAYWLLPLPVAGLVATFVFRGLNGRLMKDVTSGRYSYNENHCFWEYIHSPECLGKSAGT